MRSHSCHLVLLWNILASLATAQQEAGPAGDFIPLCRDSQGLGGQLSIAPSPAFVLAIPEKPHSTIFVKEFPSYSFKCSSGDANDEVFLSFRQKSRYPSRRRRVGPPLGWRSNSSSDQGVIVDEIQRSQLVVKDWLNGNNVTVTCATNETTFCGINLILMKESHSDEFCDTFHVKEITDKTPAPLTCNVTELSKGKGTKGSSFPTIISQRGQNFEPVVKFSIYSPELGEWVPCKKLDLPGNSTESSSSPKPMIECPVNRTEGQSHETKATVIRIEKIQNTLVGVALPVLGPPQKKSYSYFTVDVKFAAPLVRPQSEMNAEDEKDDNQIAMIVSGTIVGLTIVGLLILVAVLLHGRKNGICR